MIVACGRDWLERQLGLPHDTHVIGIKLSMDEQFIEMRIEQARDSRFADLFPTTLSPLPERH